MKTPRILIFSVGELLGRVPGSRWPDLIVGAIIATMVAQGGKKIFPESGWEGAG